MGYTRRNSGDSDKNSYRKVKKTTRTGKTSNTRGKATSRKKKGSKRRRATRKFGLYFIASFLILMIIGVVGFNYAKDIYRSNLKKNNTNVTNENNQGSDNNVVANNSENKLADILFGEKEMRVNAVVFGVDGDGYRTDVIFVVTFDTKTKKIGVLSVPRDTRVTVTDEMVEFAKEHDREIEKGFVCKINEVHAYAPHDYRNEFSVMQFEDLLSIKIDYYAKVDLEAFRSIVDVFGGVDIDVPQDMVYEDPYQDLYINLKKGMQHLDGAQAEQLVRFRRYADGDVGRVQVQQLFLKELLKKVLNTKNIMNNIFDIIQTAYKYVKTNVGLDDALKYAEYIKYVNMENVTMETLPGEGDYIGNVSYYLIDSTKSRALIDKMFYGIEEQEEVVEQLSSVGLNIEILNGSLVNGLAAKKKSELEADGFTVKSIGTYEGTKEDQTLIIVGKQGQGVDIQKYFSSSRIEVSDLLLNPNIDIKVIIGTGEK